MREYFNIVRYEYRYWKKLQLLVRQEYLSLGPGHGRRVVELMKHRERARRAFFRALIGRW